jgi:hypothetical protein
MSSDNRKPYGLTMGHANAVLAAGTTSTYSTTASTACTINGKWATVLTAQTNTASPTTDIVTGAAFVAVAVNKASVFVWGVNAAGAIKVAQGSVEDTEVGVTTTAGAFKNAPAWPNLPDDFCPIGYTLVRAAPSASSWTFGSSNWTATGITTAFVNVNVLPDRPQIA